MAQLNFSIHNNSFNCPSAEKLSILKKSMDAYKLWQEYVKDFPKISRYSLGGKINDLFIEMLEIIFTASYSSKSERLPFIRQAINKCDLLKFFLQLSWETKALDNKKFAIISENINEIGRMLGGWHNKIKKETSASNK